jgi:hypothetical protein
MAVMSDWDLEDAGLRPADTCAQARAENRRAFAATSVSTCPLTPAGSSLL